MLDKFLSSFIDVRFVASYQYGVSISTVSLKCQYSVSTVLGSQDHESIVRTPRKVILKRENMLMKDYRVKRG
jgi:hypothetical protein